MPRDQFVIIRKEAHFMPQTRQIDKEPSVSVIIPSYEPGEKIASCLSSILDAKSNLVFDLWVIDSSPSGPDKKVDTFLTDERLHLHESPRRLYPGEARDVGVKLSGGDILVFTDTDCNATEGWLDNIVKNLISSGCDACGGAIENGTPGSYFGTAEYLSEFSIFTPRNTSRLERFVPTCNLALFRSVYLEAGGFIADLRTGEDVAFGKKLQEQGKRVAFSNLPVVIHLNRTGGRDFILNQYRLGRGLAINTWRGNQPFSWVTRNALTRSLFLMSVFPGRLYRVISRAIKNREVGPGRLLYYLPGLALGALSFASGCAIQFLSEWRGRPASAETHKGDMP